MSYPIREQLTFAASLVESDITGPQNIVQTQQDKCFFTSLVDNRGDSNVTIKVYGRATPSASWGSALTTSTVKARSRKAFSFFVKGGKAQWKLTALGVAGSGIQTGVTDGVIVLHDLNTGGGITTGQGPAASAKGGV